MKNRLRNFYLLFIFLCVAFFRGAMPASAQLGGLVEAITGESGPLTDDKCKEMQQAEFGLNVAAAAEASVDPSKSFDHVGPSGQNCASTNPKTIKYQGSDMNCPDVRERVSDGNGGYTYVNYSCCVCQPTDEKSSTMIGSVDTYEQCVTDCKTMGEGFHPSKQVGAGLLRPQPQATQSSVMAQRMMYCFTPTECAQYSGTFQAGGCPTTEGKCIAPEPVVPLMTPLGSVATVKGYRGFVAALFNYLLLISGIAAGIMFVWAGFRYIFGSAFTSVQKAKDIMVDASIGLVLVIAAVAILRTVNPATLNLNKLDVFMINKKKLMIGEGISCIDIQGNLTFADAGEKPNFTPITKITSYPVKKEDTKCNSFYYPQGYADFRCSGAACSEKGMACMPCQSSGACPEGASADSFGCVKARLTGTVAYADWLPPQMIRLLAICNKAYGLRDGHTFEDVEGSMYVVTKDTKFFVPKDSTKEKGKLSYIVNITDDILKEAESDCSGDNGGVMGFMLGVHYYDHGTCVGGAVSEASRTGEKDGGTVAVVTGGVVGCAAGALGATNNDVLVVSKKWCVVGGKFPGLQNGAATTNDTEIRKAAWCGLADLQRGTKIPARITPDSVWSLADLEKSDTKPIVCNFGISNENAPVDPTDHAVGNDIFGMEDSLGAPCSRFEDGW